MASAISGANCLHQRIGEHLGVRGHRADDDRVAVVADAAELGDLGQVDHRLRRGEPQPQHRDERLPAGQDLDVLAAVGDGLQGLVDAWSALA